MGKGDLTFGGKEAEKFMMMMALLCFATDIGMGAGRGYYQGRGLQYWGRLASASGETHSFNFSHVRGSTELLVGCYAILAMAM